ncbi:MAG: HAD family phosphatase [Oscillospiraceae bacterium]|nr:HAD family phosphatase [Oscillospiraceae bacterium]
MDFEACIFDLDGTLLDSIGVWIDIDIEFLGKRGAVITEEYGRATATMRMREAADYTVKLYRLEEDPEDIMAEWMDMARDRYAHKIGLIPYAKDFLLELKAKGVPMGVATIGTKELYQPALERNGIAELFDVIVDADMVRTGKESPEIYLKAAELLGVKPEKCVVFEDTSVGLRSAASCGFKTVGILDKGSRENHEEIKAVCDIAAFDFKQFLIDT